MFLPQETNGAFGVEVNHVTAYIISEANYEITVDTISETFSGFQVNAEVQEEDTVMVVNVEGLSASQLAWNSTVNNQTITGICPDTFDYDPFFDFFHAASEALLDIDVVTPYSTGIILPAYFDPFELPLFVSIAPVTWTNMENMITSQSSIIGTRLSTYYVTAMGGNWDDTGNIASIEFWYNYSVTFYGGSSQNIYSSTNFRYNMTTGSLLDAEIG
ncbi:MAG: choice-of-anchor S family protein, partial [Candidatus Heimdallarchaeaceae archaeon]